MKKMILSLLFPFCGTVVAQVAEQDTLVTALTDALNDTYSVLQTEKYPPYFISLHAVDSKEETFYVHKGLVRSACIESDEASLLSQLEALGETSVVTNGLCVQRLEEIPYAVVCPMLYVGNLKVAELQSLQERLHGTSYK